MMIFETTMLDNLADTRQVHLESMRTTSSKCTTNLLDRKDKHTHEDGEEESIGMIELI